MESRQTHLVNVQGEKIKHWIIKWDETTLQISTGSDLNKLKTRTLNAVQGSGHEYHKNIRKKMGEGYVYMNTTPSNKFGDLLLHTRAPNKSDSNQLDIHPNGKMLVIGSLKKEARGAEIHLLDLISGALTLIQSEEAVGLNQTWIHSVHFNAAGNKILYSLNTEVKILDIETKKVSTLAKYGPYYEGPNPHCAYPAFNRLRGTYMYFDINCVKVCGKDLEPLFKLNIDSANHTIECRAASISPSGKYLALYHRSHPFDETNPANTNRIDIWDIDTHQLVKSIDAGSLNLTQIGFNIPETEIIFTQGAAEGPGFFDISSGKLLRWFKDSYRTDRWYTCYDFAYSPDQKYLAVRNSLYDANVHQKEVILFDVNNYRTNKLLFSDDSSLYIQGGDSGEIIVRQLL
jgi:WD40 repeat protein